MAVEYLWTLFKMTLLKTSPNSKKKKKKLLQILGCNYTFHRYESSNPEVKIENVEGVNCICWQIFKGYKIEGTHIDHWKSLNGKLHKV